MHFFVLQLNSEANISIKNGMEFVSIYSFHQNVYTWKIRYDCKQYNFTTNNDTSFPISTQQQCSVFSPFFEFFNFARNNDEKEFSVLKSNEHKQLKLHDQIQWNQLFIHLLYIPSSFREIWNNMTVLLLQFSYFVISVHRFLFIFEKSIYHLHKT